MLIRPSEIEQYDRYDAEEETIIKKDMATTRAIPIPVLLMVTWVEGQGHVS